MLVQTCRHSCGALAPCCRPLQHSGPPAVLSPLSKSAAYRKPGRSCSRLAVASARRTRLGTGLAVVPRRIDLYFTRSPFRRTVWALISFAAGFYAANTVSLSFGALAINDVVAAAVSVAFCEIVSYFYYSAPKATLKLIFLNAFKMGVTGAFIADAFKLGG